MTPEIYASLRPPTYESAVEAEKDKAVAEQRSAGVRPERLLRSKAAVAAPAEAANSALAEPAAAARLALADSGVSSLAAAGAVGELFQYAIDQPVTVARQKSAMLPIVNASVEAQKVSIYNESVQRKFPLNGLRLKNTTGMHLMQGPITVFDAGSYPRRR